MADLLEIGVPLDQVAPSALVNGAIRLDWAAALLKTVRDRRKAEMEERHMIVKALLKQIAGRGGL